MRARILVPGTPVKRIVELDSEAGSTHDSPATMAGPEPLEIPRIAPPPVAMFLRDYVERSRPVILKGVVSTWPAFRLWSADYMRQSYRSCRVSLAKARAGDLIHDPWDGIRMEEVEMQKAMDLIFSGGECGYYLMASIEKYLRPLREDVVVPEYCRGQVGLQSRLWVSSTGIGTPLHRDFPENLLSQIVGRKHVILYPPHDTPLLYSFPSRSRLPNFSAADAERPDHDRFPLLGEARRIELNLEAGEMLYLPSRWWHQVRSIEPSISFNFWWASGVYRWLVRAREAYEGLGARMKDWRRSA